MIGTVTPNVRVRAASSASAVRVCQHSGSASGNPHERPAFAVSADAVRRPTPVGSGPRSGVGRVGGDSGAAHTLGPHRNSRTFVIFGWLRVAWSARRVDCGHTEHNPFTHVVVAVTSVPHANAPDSPPSTVRIPTRLGGIASDRIGSDRGPGAVGVALATTPRARPDSRRVETVRSRFPQFHPSDGRRSGRGWHPTRLRCERFDARSRSVTYSETGVRGVTEVATELSLPKSTVHDYLRTLRTPIHTTPRGR